MKRPACSTRGTRRGSQVPTYESASPPAPVAAIACFVSAGRYARVAYAGDRLRERRRARARVNEPEPEYASSPALFQVQVQVLV